MRTFQDIVLSRIGPDLASKLNNLCAGEGEYRDERNRIFVPDLGAITPVEWVRLATPIVEGAHIGVLRRTQADDLRQGDESFRDFMTALTRAYMVVGIHRGWSVSTMRSVILDRLPVVLNARFCKILGRNFGPTLAVADFDDIVGTLSLEDSLKETASAAKSNPFSVYLNGLSKRRRPTNVAQETPRNRHSGGATGTVNVSPQDIRRVRQELDSIKVLLERGSPSRQPAGPSTLVTKSAPRGDKKRGPENCSRCGGSHWWKPEVCHRGPDRGPSGANATPKKTPSPKKPRTEDQASSSGAGSSSQAGSSKPSSSRIEELTDDNDWRDPNEKGKGRA
jgi:hypothetical protein